MSEFNEEKKELEAGEEDIKEDTLSDSNVDSEPLETSKPQKQGFFLAVIDYAEIFAIALCVVIMLFSVAFRTCTVDGGSMNKTLIDGETLVVSDLFYTPERGDIIVFHQTGDSPWDKNEPLVKRVIGLGGDTVVVNFSTWEIVVTDKNGESFTLDEPYAYIDESRRHMLSGIHTFNVPEGSLFVLGDNRHNSMDSTDIVRIGFVDERRVLGKVILRVAPLSRFGAVN